MLFQPPAPTFGFPPQLGLVNQGERPHFQEQKLFLGWEIICFSGQNRSCLDREAVSPSGLICTGSDGAGEASLSLRASPPPLKTSEIGRDVPQGLSCSDILGSGAFCKVGPIH